MVVVPLFPGKALNRLDLKPDTLYRVRTSYPQIAERDVVNQITSLSVRQWRRYVDGDGIDHEIWIEYVTVDTTFNIVDIYFYVRGSVAIVIIVGVLVVVGLLALSLVVKQLAIVVRGYPNRPASTLELPLMIVGGLIVLGVVIYFGTKSGALSKIAGRLAATV